MQAALQVGRQLTRPVRQAVNQAQQTRTMSSGHSMEESIGEMNKWRCDTLPLPVRPRSELVTLVPPPERTSALHKHSSSGDVCA